jgi:hypothetical protein
VVVSSVPRFHVAVAGAICPDHQASRGCRDFSPGNGGVFDVLRAQIFPSIFRPPVFDPRNQDLSSMGFESSPLFKADRARLTFYSRKTTSCA